MKIVREIVEHYEQVAPMLAAHFGGMPLVATYYPDVIAGAAVYAGPLHHDVPPSIPVATATTPSGTHRYVACAVNSVEWLAHRGALELGSWTPAATDDHCRYARVLVHPNGRGTRRGLCDGLRLVRDRLRQDELDGVVLLEARGGTVWIPLSGEPTYGDVAAWLQRAAGDLLARHPDVFTIAPLSERGDRFYLGISSNQPGRFSALPYAATGESGYAVLLPVEWTDLDAAAQRAIGIAEFPTWKDTHGNLFAACLERCGSARLPERRLAAVDIAYSSAWFAEVATGESRGPNIRAAITVLGNGRAHSVDEILQRAIDLGLLAASTPAHQLYTALIEYIARARGVGRVPQIVQDPDRRFRLNEPADDWAQSAAWQPRLVAHRQAAELTSELRSTGSGADAAAFETAACRAFAALGFIATHVGGQAAPDGYVDAPLGLLAYRAMLECKTARGSVANPDAAEAAKYRDAYRARFAALVGPAFPNEQTVISELLTHGVSAWTIDDLAELLSIDANPEELRDLFAPGFVADRAARVRWNREHGAAKRVAVICEMLVESGWRGQQHAADDPGDAPLLTEDAAMMLVDCLLAAAGAPVACSRVDVQAAFAYLTSPLVARALRVDAEHAIVIIAAP